MFAAPLPTYRVRLVKQLTLFVKGNVDVRDSLQAFTGHDLPLGPYSLASQFSNAIFTAPCDAVILSIQPDVTMSLMRHRRDGFLFYPIGAEAWPAGDRAWLQSNYEASGLLGVDAAMNNLAAIVAKIRERSEVPILIYNLSPIIPGDQIHC